MAQAGYTPIQLYYSTTASAAPSSGNLANGELALNITDGKLYYKDNGGVVQLLATKAGASGDVVGPASSTDNALVRFDGTTGKLVQNSAAVLDDSGNLTGLAAVTTSGALTLNGGTANGVAYLNGSKVLTTGSALTFDGSTFKAVRASSGSVANFTRTGGQTAVVYADTTGVAFGLDDGAGAIGSNYVYFNNSSNYAQFNLAGTEQMRLTSTGLGIGTSSPASKLQVSGSAFITGRTVPSSGVGMEAYWNGTQSYLLSFDRTTPAYKPFVIDGSTISLAINGANTLNLDSSGNLGLGVTPSAWNSAIKAYEVKAAGNSVSSSNANNIYVTNNAVLGASGFVYGATLAASYYSQGSGSHIWYTAPSGTAGNAISFTQAMTLDASGRLLVGGTSNSSGGPVQAWINGTGTSFQTNPAVYSALSTVVGREMPMIYASDGTNSGLISSLSGNMAFFTQATERARIDSSGNFLCGTTDSGITSGPGVKIAPNIGASVVSTLSTNSNSCSHVYSTGAGAYRFYVGWGGTVYATSTSISAISDATLKENVRDLETGLTEVMALRPRRFDWKNGDAQNVAGFVAQEVEQVLPELVTDYQYSEGVTKKSLKMGDILPTLVNAIQEQQAIINQLKARLDAANL